MSTSRKPADGGLFGHADAASLERIVSAAADLALGLDGDGRVLEVVAADRELQRAGTRDWRGRPWIESVAAESREKVQELLRDALAQPAVAPSWRHLNLLTRTGDDLPFLFSAAPVERDRRSPSNSRLVALGRDLRPTMTLQRRLIESQQSLERDYVRFREAEARYRKLFQSSQEATLEVDATTLRIVEANPAAVSLLGAEHARVVGVALSDLVAPSSAGAVQEALAAARSVGRHDPVGVSLARGGLAVTLSAAYMRQEPAGLFIVRVSALPAAARGRRGAAGAEESVRQDAETATLVAYMRQAADALVFTDSQGRIVAANRAFARLAQLSSEDQAPGQPLDRWLGRQGVEVGVLITNLRDTGSVGLYSTEMRGEVGGLSEVEVSAARLMAPGAAFAFAIRDTATRLRPQVADRPDVAPSVRQLTELVGRVPLKQIVAETSDLIEQMSIEAALQMARDNRALAAQLLGLSRQSLYVKLRRFGLGDLPQSPEGD